MFVAAAMAAGTALSVYGQLKAGSDEAKAYAKNAAYYEEQARYNQLVTEREEELFRQDLARIQSATIVGSAKAGLALDGSILSAMADNMVQGEREIADIQLRGKMEVEASRNQASQARTAGKAAKSNSRIAAAGTLLGGVGSLAKQN